MSKIAFIGTSITLGIRPGVVETDTFAYKVFQGRGFGRYVNAGVGGNTSTQMLSRFVADVVLKNPTHVCIEVPHVNDIASGVPCAVTEANVCSMILQALAAGLKVTVINHQMIRETPQIDAMEPRLEASARLGNMPGVAFADCYADFCWRYVQTAAFVPANEAQFAALYTDTQHPSASGHTRMAKTILGNPRACAP